MTNAMKHSNYNKQVLLFYLITLIFYSLMKRYARNVTCLLYHEICTNVLPNTKTISESGNYGRLKAKDE